MDFYFLPEMQVAAVVESPNCEKLPPCFGSGFALDLVVVVVVAGIPSQARVPIEGDCINP